MYNIFNEKREKVSIVLSIGIEIYIIIAALVITFIVVMIIVPKIKYNQVKKILLQYPNFKEYKNKYYNFTIENEESKLYIKVVDIPKNSMITINSKDTWNLSWGGSSLDYGRAYPNNRYLDELQLFLRNDYQSDKKTYKIILLNKCTEKIVRYLNESELSVVTFSDTVYGYKIMEVTKLEEQMKILGIKK